MHDAPAGRRTAGRRSVLRNLAAWAIGWGLASPYRALAQHDQGGAAATDAKGGAALVFAAATLKPVLDQIVRAFNANGGPALTVAYGPAPTLAKNIVGGAPADLFFSADESWMDYLAERNLIRSETRVDIVGNEVVLVLGGSAGGPPTNIDSSYAIAKVVGAGPIAMCDPRSHPAGRYGRMSLERLGLWNAIADKVAIVENPQAAVVMVSRGDVPAAVVFATDVYGVAGVRVAGTLADESHPPIRYPAAIVAGAAHAAAAEQFLAYLRSAAARQVFDRFGYR